MAVRAPVLGPDELRDLYSDVVRVARRIVGDNAAEDVAQETFLRLLAVSEVRPRAWLAKVARNLAIDEIRRRRRTTPVDAIPDKPVDGPDVAELLSVRRAVRDLPERDRLLLWLKHVEGRTAAEIAELVGTTRSSVEMRLFRARRALADSYSRRGGLLASILAPFVSLRRGLHRLGGAGLGAKASVGLIAAMCVGAAFFASPSTPRERARVPRPATAPASMHGREAVRDQSLAAASIGATAIRPHTSDALASLTRRALDAVIVRADAILTGVVRSVAAGDSERDYSLRVHRVWYGAQQTGDNVDFSLSGRPAVFIGSKVMLFLSETDQQPLTALIVGQDGSLFDTDRRPLNMTLGALEDRMRALRGDSSSTQSDKSEHRNDDSAHWAWPQWWHHDADDGANGGMSGATLLRRPQRS